MVGKGIKSEADGTVDALLLLEGSETFYLKMTMKSFAVLWRSRLKSAEVCWIHADYRASKC